MRPSRCLGVAIVCVAAIAAPLEIRADDRPSLAVLPFPAVRGVLTPQEGAELADDLAVRLVDTGRYRVLLDDWLSANRAADRQPSVEDLRAAAHQAGVAFIIVPDVHVVTARAPAPRAIRVLGGLAGVLLSRGRLPARMPSRPCNTPPAHEPVAAVEITAIDAASGTTHRTTASRIRLSTGRAAPRPGCGGGTVALLAAVATASPSPFESLVRANADIASRLTLTGATN